MAIYQQSLGPREFCHAEYKVVSFRLIAPSNLDLITYIFPGNLSTLTFTAQCPSQASELGLTCFPTLNDGNAATISAFTSTVVAGFATTALGFNEYVPYNILMHAIYDHV